MKNWWQKNLLLILILYLALILRLPNLNGSFWLDEAAQALEADRPWSQQLEISDDFQPPLLHLLTFQALAFNRQEWWLRTVGALIPGLLTIWGTYLLGKKLVSKKVGLLAALLLATSSFHIFFSQELCPYSLSAFWAIFSWFFLLEASKVGRDSYQLSPQNKINHFFNFFPISRDFFIFLAFSLGGLFSSYLYPFVLASQIIFLILRKDWSKTIYSLFIPFIAFLPWLSSFLAQLQAGQTLRKIFPGWEEVVGFSTWKAPVLTLGKFLFGIVDLELIYIWPTLAFLLLLGLILKQKKKSFWLKNQPKLVLFACALFLPFILAWLVSFFIPIIQPKRVIYLLPIFYLFLSWLILGDWRDWKLVKNSHWLLIIFILAINIFSTLSYYQDPRLQRENWRHALDSLHQDLSTEKTLAVFTYQAPFSPWLWYEKQRARPFPTLSTGTYNTSTIPDLRSVLSPINNYQSIIVFDYLRSLTDSQNLLINYLIEHNYQEKKVYDYPNLGFIRLYQLEESHYSEIGLEK